MPDVFSLLAAFIVTILGQSERNQGTKKQHAGEANLTGMLIRSGNAD
jgi:hypothetical protein